MTAFLYRAFLFTLLPIGLLCVIEAGIFLCKKDIFSEKKLAIVYANAGDSYKWIELVTNPHKSLLLGSSSVKYGLSCTTLNELSNNRTAFINLGMDARDPIETYFLLTQINSKGVSAVYFGLDPWIYTKLYYEHRSPYLFLDLNFIEALGLSTHENKAILIQRAVSFFKYLFPFGKTAHHFNNEVPADFGSVKLDRVPKNFNEPIDQWFQIEKYGWSQLQFEYLVKIADFCKKKGIQFTCFAPPKRIEYSTVYQQKCGTIQEQFVNNLVSRHFDAPVFGHFNQLDTVIADKELFAELYHLNANGQQVYSTIFYKMMQDSSSAFDSSYPWFIKTK